MTPPSEATLLSGSPEKALVAMLGIMINLKEVYSKEVQAMRARDLSAFLRLQPKKEAYTRDYEMLAKEIQARSLSIKKEDIRLRERLIAEQQELKVLAEESLSWCNRMAESARRVQQRLIESARESLQKDKANYQASGALGNSYRAPATAFSESC